MPLDLTTFSDKLRRYRQQFDASVEQVSQSTGIAPSILLALEAGSRKPSGDQVLILADYFKCDFNFFISDDRLTPLEQTEKLFRRYGNELSPADRWAIQEFLFLCENEAFLTEELGRTPKITFKFVKKGTFYKGHGQEAAAALRKHLGYEPDEVPNDVFHDFRRIGIHIFRRALQNSSISGLFVKHPRVGKCVLVNYSEDVYRQRFTAAHEVGHSILDDGEDFVVSFGNGKWDHDDLVELRADTFAGCFLAPSPLLARMSNTAWTQTSLIKAASSISVNVDVLVIALKREKLLNDAAAKTFKGLKIPRGTKIDPELADLSESGRSLKSDLLQKGISSHYAQLCFDAYQRGIVSANRLAEMMLINERELLRIGPLFGWSL